MSNFNDIVEENILTNKSIKNISNCELNAKSGYSLKESYRYKQEKKILKFIKENTASSNRNVAQKLGVSPSIVNYNRSKHKDTPPMFQECEKIPLVVTTRLDDMAVLAGSENDLVDNDNLLKDIEAASKPRFDMQNVSRKRKDPVYKEYYLLNNKLATYFLLRERHKEIKRKKTMQLSAITKVVLTKLENTTFGYNLTETKQPHNAVKVKEEIAIVNCSEDNNTPLAFPQMTLCADYPDNTKGLIKFKYKDYFTHAFNIDLYYILLTNNGHESIAFSFNKSWKPISLLGSNFATNKKIVQFFKSVFTREPRQILSKCCWFKLDYIIRRIYYVDFAMPKDLQIQKCSISSYHQFITSYHKCLRKSCQCCCRYKFIRGSKKIDDDSKNIALKYDSIKDVYNVTFLDNGLVDYLLKKRKSFNIIKKALTFEKPQPVTSLEEKKNTPNFGLVDTSLYFIDDKKSFSEIYTFNSNGIVVECYQFQGSFESPYNNSLLLSSHWEQAKFVTPTGSCCWFRRNKTISELKRMKCIPGVINFLNRLHLCSFYNCKCCCGTGAKWLIKKDIALHQEFWREMKHLNIGPLITTTSEVKLDIKKVKITYAKKPKSQNQNNTVLRTYEKKPKLSDNVTVQTPVTSLLKDALAATPVSTKENESSIVKTLLPQVIPQPVFRPKFSQTSSNIEKTVTPVFTVQAARPRWSIYHNYPRPVNIQQSRHVSTGFVNIAPKPGVPINNGYMPQQSTSSDNSDTVIPGLSGNITKYVISAINEVPEALPSAAEIIKAFQGLVLSIDSHGKVAASLHKPVTLFSTVELKVLSNILCRAQKLVGCKSKEVPDETAPIVIPLNNPKPLTKEEERAKQKILLFHKLSHIAKSKADAFRHCMQSYQNAAHGNITEDTSLIMPKIDECFSLQQNQELVSPHSEDPGPSGIQTKVETSKMFNEHAALLSTSSNGPLRIVGSLIQTVPNFHQIQNNNDASLFIPTPAVFQHNNQMFHPIKTDHNPDDIISSMGVVDTWSVPEEVSQYVGLENENDPDTDIDNEELDIKQEMDIDVEEECILGA